MAIVLGLLVPIAAMVPLPAVAQTPLLEADRLLGEADAMWERGDPRDIEARLRAALAMQLAWLPPDDRRLAGTYNRLCRNAFNAGHYALAEAECRLGLAIVEAAQPGSLNHARMLGDLGAALRLQRRFDDAEPFVRHSVALRRQLLDPNADWLGSGLDNLARILAGQGRLAEATLAAEEALAIRIAALGEAHSLTRETGVLAAWLRTASDAWREAGRRSLMLAISAMLMLLGTAHWAVDVERQGGPDRWRILRGLAIAAGSLCMGLAMTLAARLSLALWWPEDPDAGAFATIGFTLGLAAAALLHGGAANLLRRRAGLSRRRLLADPAEASPATPDIVAAVRRGRLRVVLPALAVTVLALLLPIPLVSHRPGPIGHAGVAVAGVVAWFVVGCVAGWLVWARQAPHWRLWALRHVDDIDALEVAAVAAGIIHPPDDAFGRWATRTEHWTTALRAEAAGLRGGRGGPAWSGEL